MKYLIKKATIIDPKSTYHKKVCDLLISNGVITQIASQIKNTAGYKEISFPNLHISQGWLDTSVSFGEPGFEERETIKNGLQVAALSGFTHVCVSSNTNPVPDSKSSIQFIKNKAAGHAVSLYPTGTVTMQGKGENLAELYDMHNEGANSFYDFKKPITNPNLLKIALLYCQTFNGLVQSYPNDVSIARTAQVHEGVISTSLGLQGIPALAEELQIARDLYILEYTGGRLHIPTISTKKSVELIKKAKNKGLQVSCSVSINNLLLTDDVLTDFNTNYKVQPPLRSKENQKALIKGLKEGIIDGVTSDHNPIDIEHKKIEFEQAYFGSIGLESCYGALQNILSTQQTVQALTQLKSVFGISESVIAKNEVANITLFNPEKTWKFTEENIQSSSKNAALLNTSMKGKVYGILANKKLMLHD